MAMNAGSSKRRRRGRAPMSEINVTPLVDVMLVLLIIFMVTAPLMSAGVPVDLPDSRAKALEQEAQEVTVSMDAAGQVYLDQDLLAPGELAARLAGIPRGPDGKPPQVTLRADRSIDYGQVMAVMGELNRSGFNAISLVTNSLVTGSSVSAP